MAKKTCLLTGNETNCTDGCYRCGCGGEVALNDCYVPIYNIQRVCDIVKNMADVSTEGEEIAEYIRNELEKMVISAADVQPVKKTEFQIGYEQGFNDGRASAALPNIIDNGDKIDGYMYMYKTDSRGEPYIHIDSVRSMLKKATEEGGNNA